MEKNLKIIVQKLEDGFNNRFYIKQPPLFLKTNPTPLLNFSWIRISKLKEEDMPMV